MRVSANYADGLEARIKELEAENARMRAALQQIADQADANWTRDVARVGLTGTITVAVGS